jgi:maltooligosyltrehalose trehalohydrolase
MMLLSPYVPLLFMGEEYDEPAPFHYFVDHSDPALIENVRAGRKREIPGFGAAAKFADPAAIETFAASRLNFELRKSGRHAVLWKLYQRLLALRRQHAAIRQTDRSSATVETLTDRPLVMMRRRAAKDEICVLLNFGSLPMATPPGLAPPGDWRKAFDSAALEWNGPGETAPGPAAGNLGPTPELTMSPWSCVLCLRDG